MIDITQTPDSNEYSVEIKPDMADDILVVGPRHQMDDFRCRPANRLGFRTSGVLGANYRHQDPHKTLLTPSLSVLGINRGNKSASSLAEGHPVRVYRVTGFLGKSTENHFGDSRVTTRYSFDHVYEEKINRLLSSMQSSHQKKMFDLAGVALDSQAAFELASQGPIRPSQTTMPLIYSIKLVELRKPFFTVEIHCINETEDYLGLLVHEIALDLKSVAHCTKIRCIRYGHFTLEDSVLRHNWNLQSLLNSMSFCNKLTSTTTAGQRPDHAQLVKVGDRA